MFHTATGDCLYTLNPKGLLTKDVLRLVPVQSKPYSIGIINSEKGAILDIKNRWEDGFERSFRFWSICVYVKKDLTSFFSKYTEVEIKQVEHCYFFLFFKHTFWYLTFGILLIFNILTFWSLNILYFDFLILLTEETTKLILVGMDLRQVMERSESGK